MVRVAGLMGQEAAGFGVRSADGLTPQQALASIRARVLELTARQSKLWKRELRPGARGRGDRDRHDRGVHERRSCSARARLRARHLPGADAARGRLGPAVPVHLRAVALARRARRRPGDGGGAVRARQGPGRARPVRRRRQAARPARGRDRPLPPDAVPRDGDRRAGRRSGSRATPTSRSPTTPTTCSKRSSRSSAAAASATSSGVEVSGSASAGMLERLRDGLGAEPTTRSTRSRAGSTSPSSCS